MKPAHLKTKVVKELEVLQVHTLFTLMHIYSGNTNTELAVFYEFLKERLEYCKKHVEVSYR